MCETIERCAICQKPSEAVLCETCKATWGETSAWIVDLKALEQTWRGVNAAEAEYTTATTLGADGHLGHAQHAHLHVQAIERRWELNESERVMHAVDLWASMGGLTELEQHALHLMSLGAEGQQAAEALSELEHHELTISAFRRRIESIHKKIRQAVRAGEIDLELMAMVVNQILMAILFL